MGFKTVLVGVPGDGGRVGPAAWQGSQGRGAGGVFVIDVAVVVGGDVKRRPSGERDGAFRAIVAMVIMVRVKEEPAPADNGASADEAVHGDADGHRCGGADEVRARGDELVRAEGF